ncbi:MAG: xanthine dehydrogenase family protein molybdopterin-binding subunit, partial [Gammaproteobacteria bacterium]|nr:xanthine dehydrogenase family protein molybdopterin-binding subunit [Gammaproteobacteria bacterium]
MRRRTILWAGLGGVGALFIGWGALPVRQRLRGSHELPVNQGQIALNGWVKISEDESVTVMVPRCELGQGIHTGLAMLLAEELDCDWQHIKVENAPIDALYNNLAVVADGLPFHPDNQGMLRNASEHLTKK